MMYDVRFRADVGRRLIADEESLPRGGVVESGVEVVQDTAGELRWLFEGRVPEA
jgi:hypothetical protein